MNEVLGSKRVAILVHNYFEQSEFEQPIKTLLQVGIEITVVSTESTALQAMEHADKANTFQADLLLANAEPDNYDAVVLPGGVINSDKLRVNKKAQAWVLRYLQDGKPVAAICHAPWLLVSADCIEGKRLTSYHTLRDDIINAGGEWSDSAVIVDNNLITSRQPSDLKEFNKALVEALR